VRTLPPGLHTETKTVYYEVDALSITSMKAASERMADQQLDRDEHGTLFWSYARQYVHAVARRRRAAARSAAG